MSQSSAALLGHAMRMVGALFSLSRGRHTRPALFGFRRRSRRVRRYAENPGPARRPTLHAPRQAAPHRPERHLAPPTAVFDASDIDLVRPYYADHERRRAQNAADRAQAEARTRLARWTAQERRTPEPLGVPSAPGGGTLPEHHPANPPVPRVPAARIPAAPGAPGAPRPRTTGPAPTAGARIPDPRPHPPGDLLAPPSPLPPARSLREVAADMGDLRTAVRTWVAQREAQEARRGLEAGV